MKKKKRLASFLNFLYFLNSWIVNTFNFAGHMVSVATILFCPCSVKAAARDSTKGDKHGYTPVKLVVVGLAHWLQLLDPEFGVLRQGQESLSRGEDYNLSFEYARFR